MEDREGSGEEPADVRHHRARILAPFGVTVTRTPLGPAAVEALCMAAAGLPDRAGAPAVRAEGPGP